MATSIYLGGLLFILLTYPFALVIVQIAAYGEFAKKRYTKWLNISCGSVFLVLLVLHLQTEVIYGKELLEWASNQFE